MRHKNFVLFTDVSLELRLMSSIEWATHNSYWMDGWMKMHFYNNPVKLTREMLLVCIPKRKLKLRALRWFRVETTELWSGLAGAQTSLLLSSCHLHSHTYLSHGRFHTDSQTWQTFLKARVSQTLKPLPSFHTQINNTKRGEWQAFWCM